MNKLINDDCMNVMKDYEDNHFDLAICDPPYGKKPLRNADGFGSKRKFKKDDDKWDIKPKKEYFDELFRVSKNQIIWGGNYFIDNLYPTNSIIVWDKLTGKNPFSDCEIAWTSHSSNIKKFTLQWLGSHCHRIEHLIHPTQKPVKLYEWLLNNYAEKGQKILDTHLGSGSIAIACHYFGVDLLGIEIDKEYYEKAKDRIDKLTRQGVLF
tara:strand:+ start:49 stop:675 length:627 start_codon:yes stop_codon:yes gene_type:complete